MEQGSRAWATWSGERLSRWPISSTDSLAIDAGNEGLTTVTTDQRGLPRVVGAEMDIGSFEIQ
ncbi:MAG: choice-of-anchor Q domain-containing protein [Cyanobacteriota bacterium]